jgi:hypothetical protein
MNLHQKCFENTIFDKNDVTTQKIVKIVQGGNFHDFLCCHVSSIKKKQKSDEDDDDEWRGLVRPVSGSQLPLPRYAG